MGFFDTFGPLLTSASYGVSGYLKGQQEAKARQQQQMMNMIQLRQKQIEDANTASYRAAQTKDMEARAARETAQAAREDAAATHKVNVNRTDYANLAGRGLAPAGLTNDQIDNGDWTGIRTKADDAKTKTDLENLKGDIQKEVQNVKNQGSLAVANAQIEGRASEGAANRANARTLEQMREQFKTTTAAGGPGGPGKPLTAQMMQGLTRLGMSYNDLTQAIDRMDKYENNPDNLKKLTPWEQTKGAAADFHPSDAHGITGQVGNAVGSFVGAVAQRNLAKTDPLYRQYLLDKQRVGLAFTEILPRPNQQVLGMEKGISGTDAGWTPDIIASVQDRRRGGLNIIKGILSGQGYIGPTGEFMPASGGGGAAAPAPKTTPTVPTVPGAGTKKRKVTIGGVSYDMP